MRADVEQSNSVSKVSAGTSLADRLGIKPAAKPTAAASERVDQIAKKARVAADAALQAPESAASLLLRWRKRSYSRLAPTPGSWTSVAAAAAMTLVSGVYILAMALPPAPKDLDYDLYRFGQIPVVEGGRVKPLDSAACSALLEISGRTYLEVGHGKEKRKIPAIQWLLDVMADTDAGREYEVFRVENLEVQEIVGVRKREGMRYSRNEISKKEKEFEKQVALAQEAEKKDKRQLSVYQRKILELHYKLATYDNLNMVFGLPVKYKKALTQEARFAVLDKAMERRPGQPVLAVVPSDNEHEWLPLAGAWLQNLAMSMRGQPAANPTVTEWTEILQSYADSKTDKEGDKKRPQDFNRAVTGYLKSLDEHPPRDLKPTAIRFEAFFNHFQPFTHVDRLYVVAFVIGALGWLGWTQGFNRMAFWLQVFILSVHTCALVGRIYISGRPPVTNLYSSAVFIGWGCVGLGLILEMEYRLGIGNLIASVAGYATLLIADGLALKGDTFTVLQAVLDTQFWLATHVTTITMGYATTYLAGLLGVVYVMRGVLTPSLTPAIAKDLSRMIYGTLCFSIFFSFVGTVLGGLWADDSWGRFWGWDPKENGALIIVLWNALVLHARWGGMVKERGMAVLAIAGNIFVSWSWWGVNELGAGLHSYGFTEGTVIKLAWFVLANLVLIGVGLIPKRLWCSERLFAGVD